MLIFTDVWQCGRSEKNALRVILWYEYLMIWWILFSTNLNARNKESNFILNYKTLIVCQVPFSLDCKGHDIGLLDMTCNGGFLDLTCHKISVRVASETLCDFNLTDITIWHCDHIFLIFPFYFSMMRHWRKNRDYENDLMKDVPGWKTGMLYDEPLYYNIRGRYMRPSHIEYFAHNSFLTEYNHLQEKLEHWILRPTLKTTLVTCVIYDIDKRTHIFWYVEKNVDVQAEYIICVF